MTATLGLTALGLIAERNWLTAAIPVQRPDSPASPCTGMSVINGQAIALMDNLVKWGGGGGNAPSLNVVKSRLEGQFRIALSQATTYTKGAIHLVGDAAHCHAPVGGRGMNLGIDDAA